MFYERWAARTRASVAFTRPINQYICISRREFAPNSRHPTADSRRQLRATVESERIPARFVAIAGNYRAARAAVSINYPTYRCQGLVLA